jgi:RNA polymerase sigma-70 factor, ECF subfamily
MSWTGLCLTRQGTIVWTEVSYRVSKKNRMKSEDDAGLVSRCQRGNTDAFEILVERHQKKMLNVAYRVTGDYDEACEVVQEAFFSAYRAIRGFKGDAKFSTWLTSITINHARNRVRQTQSRSRHEVVSLDDPVETDTGHMRYDPPSQELSAMDRLERTEVRMKVQGCVDALGNEYREVLVLCDMEEFSYNEIGSILKIPDGTVKSRLYRARSSVKDCLKKVMGHL